MCLMVSRGGTIGYVVIPTYLSYYLMFSFQVLRKYQRFYEGTNQQPEDVH